MGSLSLSYSSTPVAKRMLSDFLQEPQEPFLFQMRKLGKHGGMRSSRAAGFLELVLAKLKYGRSSCNDNGKSSVFSCFSDHSDDHQLSPVSVLQLQYSDESSPSLNDHNNTDSPTKASSTVEEIHYRSLLFNKRRRLFLLECLRKETKEETKERVLSVQDCLRCSDRSEKAMNELIFSWESQKSYSSSSGEEWNKFKPEAREIGLCLEALIFDELREETIVDMFVLHCT